MLNLSISSRLVDELAKAKTAKEKLVKILVNVPETREEAEEVPERNENPILPPAAAKTRITLSSTIGEESPSSTRRSSRRSTMVVSKVSQSSKVEKVF